MTILPEWLDYVHYDRAAASMLRRLNGPTSSWGELLASGQSVMSHYNDDLSINAIESLYDEQRALPLIAASRILDAASQRGDLESEANIRLGLTAAVAYGMYGNFLSAAAVISRLKEQHQYRVLRDVHYAVAISTVAPKFLSELLAVCEEDSVQTVFLEKLEQYLVEGKASLVDGVRSLMVECILGTDSSFKSSLLRSARISLEHLFNLSVSRVLGDNCQDLSQRYIGKLIDSGVRVFLPPQFRAISNNKLVTSAENSLVSLPTSTGKTLLGELCMVNALAQPGLACFLAPYVALGSQVMASFEKHIPSDVRKHLMVGGFRATKQLDPINHRELIVATPERLDALLRLNSDLIPNITCIVCDEAHLIQSGPRGLRLEGLLTRLRLLQRNGNGLRLILLSAVLSDYPRIQRWLDIPSEQLVTSEWRPTARRLAIWRSNGTLEWYLGDDPVRYPQQSGKTVLGNLHLPWPNQGFYQSSSFGAIKQQEPLAHSNVAYLCQFLLEAFRGPILCVSATRSSTRKLASEIAKRLPEIEPLPQRLMTLITRINQRYPFLASMAEQVKSGVAYHNSSVPQEIRQIIEGCAKDRLLQVVVATTTLAEGVDLPFRFTILADWLSWEGQQQLPMENLLFRNIAGRCGRAGEFTEGDTVIFENPVGAVQFTNPMQRTALLGQLFLSAGPDSLKSVLDGLPSALPARKTQLEAIFASQFMAAISENPNEENLEHVFLERTFVFQYLPTEASTEKLLQRITSNLTDEGEGAIARAASPLRLTTLGVAANNSGFSPISARRILAFLRETEENPGHVELICDLLRKLGNLPEQTNDYFLKVLRDSNKKAMVKNEDLEYVVSEWLKGAPEEEIFKGLPKVRKSKRTIPINDWLGGTLVETTWDADFDKFIDLISQVLKAYTTWLLRACSALSGEIADSRAMWSLFFDWSKLAEMVESGVDSEWAIAALSRGAPANRDVTAYVGRHWPSHLQLAEDALGVILLNEDTVPIADVIFRQTTAQFPTSRTNEVLALRSWLFERAGIIPTGGLD